MRRYDIVLLDSDNTLFDFDRAEEQTLREVFASRGYPWTAEAVDAYHRINWDLWSRFNRGEVSQEWLTVERFARFMAVMGGDHDPAAMNDDYQAGLSRNAQLFPGAKELCHDLAAECSLYIMTNGLAASVAGRLERAGIAGLIRGVFISQKLGCQKPQREFFQKVYQAIGLTPAEQRRTVVVGDTLETDILGAINGGIDSIWYNPKHKLQNVGICPTWEADHFTSVRQIILGENLT